MQNNNLNDKIQKDFLNYANAVIKSRAIPRSEDNLKPVHRRILYTMAENKFWSNKSTVKSANVVGLTMLYHPHGDASIYDALIRMAQPWKMRYPFIETQGNIGNILGDGPAASRYTECRLSKVGELMLDGISKNSVPFKSSYDDKKTEPVILPSLFPNILCNGNSGIAVGLSSSLVSHNFNEVVAGIMAYLGNRGISVEKLMEHIKGPDFPTGGTIIDGEKLLDIYKTGNGTVTLRSKYVIENVGQKQHIIITELPYLVNIEDGVIEPLKKLVTEENFDLIEDYSNETNKDGIRLRIILKKGANVHRVLETLWSKTRLQITQKINNTVIVNGNPKVLNLKELIEQYVSHRHQVIINATKFSLDKIINQIEVSQGLISALSRIKEVIDIILDSSESKVAKTKLISLLGINEHQASAILDTKLGRLNKLDSLELKAELENLLQEKKKLEDILENSMTRDNIIRKDLLGLKISLGDDRRTTIAFSGLTAGQELSSEPIQILLFKNGDILPTQRKIKDLAFGKRGSQLEKTQIVSILETHTNTRIFIFDQEGKVYNQNTLTLTLESIEGSICNGEPVAQMDLEGSDKQYLIFLTSGGYVKKTNKSEYLSAKNNTMSIKLKDGDKLSYVGLANDNDFIMALTSSGKIGKIKVSSITATSRLTIGSRLMSEEVKQGIIVSENEKIFSINSSGQGKVSNSSDYNETSKGGLGQVIAENTIIICSASKPYVILQGEKNAFLDISTMPIKSKSAAGAKVASYNIFSITN